MACRVTFWFKARAFAQILGIYCARGEIDNFMQGKI